MSTKTMVCALGILGALVSGCESESGEETGDDRNMISSGCTDNSPTPCTPAGDLRKFISDLLRLSVTDDLRKNGVAPTDDKVKFVYKTMLLQRGNVYVAASIMRGDGATSFDLTGTAFAGKSNTVQALLDMESGSVMTHQIGIGLEPKAFACEFATHFDGPTGLYPGDVKADCKSNGASAGDNGGQKVVDDDCAVSYSQAAGHCNSRARDDDAAFKACLAPVKADLKACCADGGSPTCDSKAR